MSLSNKKTTPRRSVYEKLEQFGSAKPKLQSTGKVQAARQSLMKMATPSESDMPASAKTTYSRSYAPSPAPFALSTSPSKVEAEQHLSPESSKNAPVFHNEGEGQTATFETRTLMDAVEAISTPMSKVSIMNAVGSALSTRILDFHEQDDDVAYASPVSIRSHRSQELQELNEVSSPRLTDEAHISGGSEATLSGHEELQMDDLDENTGALGEHTSQNLDEQNQSLDHRSLLNEGLDGTCVRLVRP